ncbi:MAG: hypothetical protein FJ087_14250 [Deltaproteobacteria bacterium]|nr:hypothetical protein [Deltaproteobacteria bacterium]
MDHLAKRYGWSRDDARALVAAAACDDRTTWDLVTAMSGHDIDQIVRDAHRRVAEALVTGRRPDRLEADARELPNARKRRSMTPVDPERVPDRGTPGPEDLLAAAEGREPGAEPVVPERVPDRGTPGPEDLLAAAEGREPGAEPVVPLSGVGGYLRSASALRRACAPDRKPPGAGAGVDVSPTSTRDYKKLLRWLRRRVCTCGEAPGQLHYHCDGCARAALPGGFTVLVPRNKTAIRVFDLPEGSRDEKHATTAVAAGGEVDRIDVAVSAGTPVLACERCAAQDPRFQRRSNGALAFAPDDRGRLLTGLALLDPESSK